MRWVKKYKRHVKRFAILPIKVGNEYRWLETVYIRQRRRNRRLIFDWYNVEFVTKEEYEGAPYLNDVPKLSEEATKLYRQMKEAFCNDR